MDQHLSIGADAPLLLAPIEALLRGFEFAPAIGHDQPAAPVTRVREATDGLQARQGFCIGALNLMIPYAEGSELTEMLPVHRLPNAPHWFAGMANLHGMLVPVFDLARHFDIERPAPKKPMLLVLAHGADAAGIVIDGLPKRLRWSAEQVADDSTVPESIASMVHCATLIDGQLWFDLDSRALLAQLEQSLGASQ